MLFFHFDAWLVILLLVATPIAAAVWRKVSPAPALVGNTPSIANHSAASDLPAVSTLPALVEEDAAAAADRAWRARFANHAVPAALSLDPNLPAPAEYALEPRPLPQIGRNPWEAVSKDALVTNHLDYIAKSATRIGNAHQRLVARYLSHKRGIVGQRRAITTTLHLADHFIGDALASRAAHADVQPVRAVPMPATPIYETPEQLLKRFDQITAGGVQALGRAYMSGAHPVYFAIAIVATVAASTISFQKSVRKMAESDAQLRRYAFHVATQADVLLRSIGEIGRFSAELHAIDTELHQLLDGLAERAVWERYCNGTCDADEKQRTDRLLSLTMMAKAYAAMGD